MAGLRGTTRMLAFVKIAMLARLLGPLELGIYGIAAIVLGFLETVTETGVNAFLIQEDEDIQKYLNSAWVVSIYRGALITVLILVSAFPIVWFFNATNALGVILLSSLIPLARGFINPAEISFQKNLHFHKEFSFRTVIFAIDLAATLVAAIILHSAIAISIGMLIGVLTEVLLSFIVISPRPKFVFERDMFRHILNRGKWVTFANIFNYLYMQLDDVFVGRILGTYSLGLYQTAYKISTLPISEGGEVIVKVVYPIYVKIREDVRRLRSAYLKVLGLLSLLFIPFAGILYFFSDFLIGLVLGPEWLPASGALKILAIYGAMKAITGSSSALFLAVKKQEYISIITGTNLIVMLVLLIPLINMYGLPGAAVAVLSGSIASLPLMGYFSYKVLRST